MTEKRSRGRPPHQPSEDGRSRVKLLAGLGLTQEQIALVHGVSVDTLSRHYRAELDEGAAQATAQVAQSLFKMATDPQHPKAAVAAIFWMKVRASWRDGGASSASQGKKEAASAKASAVAGSGKYRPSARPKLIVNNNR